MVDVYSIRSQRTGARTPPPTLLFSLHLSKNTRLTRDRKNNLEPPDHPDPGPSGLEAAWRWALSNRAADEVVLSEPLPWVNTYFEEFCSKSALPAISYSIPTSFVTHKSVFAFALISSGSINRPKCFSLSSEEPLETCHILASMARAVDRDQMRSRSGPR